MARKTIIALVLTLALTVGATVPAFAASEQATSGTTACAPTISILGGGAGYGPGNAGFLVTYISSCATWATVTFSATSPTGKVAWTQQYHHYMLGTVATDISAEWIMTPQLPPGDYTIRFEVASQNGRTTYLSFVIWTLPLP